MEKARLVNLHEISLKKIRKLETLYPYTGFCINFHIVISLDGVGPWIIAVLFIWISLPIGDIYLIEENLSSS